MTPGKCPVSKRTVRRDSICSIWPLAAEMETAGKCWRKLWVRMAKPSLPPGLKDLGAEGPPTTGTVSPQAVPPHLAGKSQEAWHITSRRMQPENPVQPCT